MSSSIEQTISPTLSNLIAEVNYTIGSVKEKILTAYKYAVETDGFTPKEAAKLLREKLDFSDRYIRECLPLEAKDQSKVNKSDAEPVPHKSQENDKNVVNITTAYDIKEAETTEEFKPSSSMEEFRKQHGTVEQEQEPQEREEPDEIYDKQFVDRLIKENAQLVNSFTFEYDLEVKDQILPLKVTCYPDKKTGYVRLDKGRLKK
jgi:cell division septum initiation protein DivIVA